MHPVVKHHDLPHYLNETPPTWDQALVETLDDQVRGFAAYAYSSWNRRIVLLHMYVDAAARPGHWGALLDEILSARAQQHRANKCQARAVGPVSLRPESGGVLLSQASRRALRVRYCRPAHPTH